MKMINNVKLENLAMFLNEKGITLYIVGGFIRGKLQGLSEEECGDIDLCSACKIEELIELSEEGGYSVEILNKTLGVCVIKLGDIEFEHATFRSEVYEKKGKHCPKQVEFILNLEEDAKRRDFTVNAIYYDIYNHMIIDPTKGQNDLKKGVLKVIGDANAKFREDAERMLRAIRVASTYNLNLDLELKEAISKNAKLLQSVKPVRRNRELNKILYADIICPTFNSANNSIIFAFNLMNELGMLKYIMPELNSLLLSFRGKKKFYQLLLRLKFCENEVKYITLFCGIVTGLRKSIFNADDKQMIEYLFETYYVENNSNVKLAILQKTAQICLKITKYGLKTDIINEIMKENSVIIPMIINYFEACELAKSKGKKSGKISNKLKSVFASN